ncbi:DNA sulfur modification protein DndB [Acetobacter sp.]|uniref:DNA sulfur modification protein DndB n=1 Tax=Acetobacter sp. TaxID=440 RepID=UPI0039EC1B0B
MPPGGTGNGGIRGIRLETKSGETAAFKVFLSERHVLWVIDGQHRRHAAEMALNFLDTVRQTGRYPGKGVVLFAEKGKPVEDHDMIVWNEAYEAARMYATLTVEVHLGLNIEQERQLFHDLNRLGKKVDASLAFQFDGSNPITLFIKHKLTEDLGLRIIDTEVKDWSKDTAALVLKDVVAINATAFLNKGNITGATPALIEPRENAVQELWGQIVQIPGFGENRSKEKTVAAQPVVLKALAKISYDLNINNRRPENASHLYQKFLNELTEMDFSHGNSMWRYYQMSDTERSEAGLDSLTAYLPEDNATANRDIGAVQGGYFRFGAKHNDIFPILADMIRWKLQLPSRREK